MGIYGNEWIWFEVNNCSITGGPKKMTSGKYANYYRYKVTVKEEKFEENSFVVNNESKTYSGNKAVVVVKNKLTNYSGSYNLYKPYTCDNETLDSAPPIPVAWQSIAEPNSERIVGWNDKVIELPIKCHVQINNYIESISQKDIPDEEIVPNRVEYAHNPVKEGSRKGWSSNKRKKNPAVAEVGDKIVYNVTITNKTLADVYIDLTDNLPNGLKNITISRTNYKSVDVDVENNNLQSKDWPKHKEEEANADKPFGNSLVRIPKASLNSEGKVVGKVVTYTITAYIDKGTYKIKGGTSTAKIKKTYLTNAENGYNKSPTKKYEVTNKSNKTESSDYYICKKYNVAIDQAIVKVSHTEAVPLDGSSANSQITYTSNETEENYNYRKRRSGITLSNGKGDKDTKEPVFVEYGDEVTYEIYIYNTTNSNYYNVSRGKGPYYNPQEIYANLKINLPNKYSNLEILDGTTNLLDSTDNKLSNATLTLKNIQVGGGEVKKLTLKFMVENSEKGLVKTNTATITQIKNRNGKAITYNKNKNDSGYKNQIKNLSKRLTCTESYKLNDYNAKLEEYIYSYDAAMEVYNINNGFSRGNSGAFNENKNENHNDDNHPLDVEKYETLTYVTKITNQASGGEFERNTEGSYAKYNTRVRPTSVKQTIDDGLTMTKCKIYWYHSSTGERQDISPNVVLLSQADTNSKKMVYTFRIEENDIILSPGDYITYETTIVVTESNMCLNLLKYTSEIEILSNVNRNMEKTIIAPYSGDNIIGGELCTRRVTGQNISGKTSSTTYVRLKDLIIAGKVWIDDDGRETVNNRDGYMSVGEKYQKGIKVKLYSNIDGEYKVRDTTTTDQNGFYNFGRKYKSSTKNEHGNYTSINFVNYYVEFEYDGALYKATEVYGGDNDGFADGMQNLMKDNGGEKWRQGYAGLPGTTSGASNYMIDSNAYEFDDVRNAFNERNQTIGYNHTYDADAKNGAGLSYKKDGHKSTLTSSSDTMRARSFITQNYDLSGINESIQNTRTLPFLTQEGKDACFSYLYHKELPETEYLKFINLGLVPREKVDISIDADVKSVTTYINGEEMTYTYNDNQANSTDNTYYNDTYDKVNNFSIKDPYKLDLYDSDYNYRCDQYYSEEEIVKDYKGPESELEAQVKYTVTIRNNKIENDEPNTSKVQDIPVETAINELGIYYDTSFIKPSNFTEQIKVKTKDENGIFKDKELPKIKAQWIDKNDENKLKDLTIKPASNYSTNKDNDNLNGINEKNNYNILYLSGIENQYLAEGESMTLEITFTIKKEEIDGLLRLLKLEGHNNTALSMIAEIGAYTTRYKPNTEENKNGYAHQGLAGKPAGLIDRDSNPDNVGLNNGNGDEFVINNALYEDDTYEASIKLGLIEEEDPPTPPPPPDPPDYPTSRQITGMVWDDARSKTIGDDTNSDDEVDKNIQYAGDGTYDTSNKNNANAKTNTNIDYNNDTPVEGIKVSLIEVVQTQAVNADGGPIYYEFPAEYTYDWTDSNGVRHEKGEKIETRTDSEGKYTLDKFIPGYYKVRFDYGDNVKLQSSIIYNGQDYKSTTYYNGEYYKTDFNDNIGSEANFDYFDKVKGNLIRGGASNDENDKIVSDAQDDEIRRLNVNSYSETMTTKQAQVFSKSFEDGGVPLKAEVSSDEIDENKKYREVYQEELTKYTSMFADSTIFYVKPENVASEITDIDIRDWLAENASEEELNDVNNEEDRLALFNKKRIFRIDNLDFGIEYRPEASIILTKNIETLELTTSEGKSLLKLCFEDDGNGGRKINERKSKGSDNVQFVSNVKKEKRGFVYLNMDTEILEGCTITVGYDLTAENRSEIDRVNKNLYEIKYEIGANAYGKQYKVYANTADEYTYNANATASQYLAGQYYDNSYQYSDDTGKESYKYLKKIKKSYIDSDNNNSTTIDTESNTKEILGSEYYGRYLGQTYYTGEVGIDDEISELKVDHILDYVDNDFTFKLADNNTKNKTWQVKTTDQLRKLLDFSKVYSTEDDPQMLVDRDGIRYDTGLRSNLALSVDTNKMGDKTELKDGNYLLSKFLETKNKNNNANATKEDDKAIFTGEIKIQTSKVLSADEISNGRQLNYENIAEVIQFTNITGRRTLKPKTEADEVGSIGGIIGNANVTNWNGYQRFEDDTDATEVITISPPTGLIE